MKNVYVVCADGLHNNGKTTQLALLSERLEQQGIPTLIRRGDGMRKGEGREVTDPESKWWQENIARMRATGFEGPASMKASEESANRLNRELYVCKHYILPQRMQREGRNTGVILLDRGSISRLFVARRENPNAQLEDVRYFTSNNGRQEIVMPDLIFLMHAPLDVLQSRNDGRDKLSGKQAFNDTVLTKFYGDFDSLITNLPIELQQRTVVIDSRNPLQEIHEIMYERTIGLIEASRQSVEGQVANSPERR